METLETKKISREELNAIKGGTVTEPSVCNGEDFAAENSCNGVGNCQTCKNSCKDSCKDSCSSSSKTGTGVIIKPIDDMYNKL